MREGALEGAPRRLKQPGWGGPSRASFPGPLPVPRAATPHAPGPRALPLGRVSRTTAAAALPRRGPRPVAHLSRGSIQLVLLVLWSM